MDKNNVEKWRVSSTIYTTFIFILAFIVGYLLSR